MIDGTIEYVKSKVDNLLNSKLKWDKMAYGNLDTTLNISDLPNGCYILFAQCLYQNQSYYFIGHLSHYHYTSSDSWSNKLTQISNFGQEITVDNNNILTGNVPIHSYRFLRVGWATGI